MWHNTRKRNLFVFILLWVVLFILYLPAAKAGMVGDYPGWAYQLKRLSFLDYINRSWSQIKGLYQFTQTATYCFFYLFGNNVWLWHLLNISMQAINSYLLFILFFNLFRDSKISNAFEIALSGTVLYTVCPLLTEVIVWEPAYHYLQGFLIMLTLFYFLQKFQHDPKNRYAWVAGIIFFASTFTLEIFYITPWLCLVIILFYRYALQYDKGIFKKSLFRFFLPQILMLIFYFILVNLLYKGFSIAHLANNVYQPISTYLTKPAKYIFHIVFFGRLFPFEVRNKIYELCNSKISIFSSTGVLLLICTYIMLRFRHMPIKGKILSMVFVCTMINLAIILPMWFPQLLLVIYDRYTYFINGFVFMMIALLVSYIPNKIFRITLVSVYAIISIYCTSKLNTYWRQSAAIVNNLLTNFPDPGNKIVIALSIPECLKGVQMIGTREEGELKMIHNILRSKQINNTVYDGMSFNMLTPDDGTHVTVLNDSVVRVTLNQWGTWWWYGGLGGTSYKNTDYSLDMRDQGHMYELTLKKPAAAYLLLYQAGKDWHIVDWNKKNVEQY